MSMKIVKSPDPSLLRMCEPCAVGDRALLKLAKNMAKTMYENNGCGIAAPQVGRNIRLIVIDVDWDGETEASRNPIFLVNPEIQELRGEPVVDAEACLSCPGISVPISRQPWARVSYYDLDGEEWEIEGDGLLGRCLQHEIDHLNGRTLFEACSPDVRIKAIQAYDQACEMGAKPGETAIAVEG